MRKNKYDNSDYSKSQEDYSIGGILVFGIITIALCVLFFKMSIS
jgi:hypothetical protein